MTWRAWPDLGWGLGLIATLTTAMCVDAEGYQFPPQVRGELVARLAVHVATADKAPRGVVTLTVTVEGGANLEVAKARLDDPTDAWKVLQSSSRALEDGRAVSSQTFQLSQAKLGPSALPAVTVRFRAGPEVAWEEAMWTNILQDARPAPPPDPVAVEATSRSGWLFAVAGVSGAVVAAYCWLLRRPRQSPELSPAAQAFRELAEVDQAALGTAERHRRLSEIVRRYLAERRQLPALRQTSEEFLGAHGEQVPATVRQALAEFLQRCDLAKFAPPWPADSAGTEKASQDTAALARHILEACEDEQSAVRPEPAPSR